MGVVSEQVIVARARRPGYGDLPAPGPAPELWGGAVRTVAQAAVRELFLGAGLDRERAGTPEWNPLSAFIAEGAAVVLKPNWVLHANESGAGLECLVTHPSVIEAVLHYVALARPGKVVLGDAPLQGCDLPALHRAQDMETLCERFRRRGLPLSLCDFRRTLLPGGRLGNARLEERRGEEHYVLFDLKDESLLDALQPGGGGFRVTMYNPDLLQRTHAPGRHRYLVAREVIEADVVLSLPKLKTHKKACLTGALKNLVGINGNKEYLPHHRKGSPATGGDCYGQRSRLKALAEDLLDAANRRRPGRLQALLARSALYALRGAALLGAEGDIEGGWHGNDTVWRTCLDLQRVLRYGRADGTLAPGDVPQRRVLSLTDAIVAGEGEGPLGNTPVAAGFLTFAESAAAADFVHARLLGLDPRRIPLVRQAFSVFPHPLTSCGPEAVRALVLGPGPGAALDLPAAALRPAHVGGRAVLPPRGWRGACELGAEHGDERAESTLLAPGAVPRGASL